MSEKTNYQRKLADPRWQKKRLKILERDFFACQICTDTETELQVHHTEYSGEPWDASDENLKTLCAHCHKAETTANKIGDTLFMVFKKGGDFYARTKKGALLLGKIDDDKNLVLSMYVKKPMEFMTIIDNMFKKISRE